MTPRPVRIGCSGWQYKSWRETFYPPKLPQRRWLEHYATQFDTVEVNSTFYRLGEPHPGARWGGATTADLLLARKGAPLHAPHPAPQRAGRAAAPLLRGDRALGLVRQARTGAVAV